VEVLDRQGLVETECVQRLPVLLGRLVHLPGRRVAWKDVQGREHEERGQEAAEWDGEEAEPEAPGQPWTHSRCSKAGAGAGCSVSGGGEGRRLMTSSSVRTARSRSP
jgi:hypothetical protein